MLDDQGLCCFQISIQYNRSDSLPTAPCSAGTRAEHSKQAARARPKGLARLALCPPPTETREKCRRSKAFEGYLRRKRGKSVGGPELLRGTSDRNGGKVSEVSRKKKGPPTVLLCFCQRSPYVVAGQLAADGNVGAKSKRKRTRSSPRCSAGRSVRMLRDPTLRGGQDGRC